MPVYANGPLFAVSHGRHYAADGYYFGQRWQCVEFVKRYLYQAKGHRMPDVMGHAISFFDPSVSQGALNTKRGMIQFAAGGKEWPKQGDLVVFGGAGGYGHVGIVASTIAYSTAARVEIIQQNKSPAHEWLEIVFDDKGVTLAGGLPVLGWLRVPRLLQLCRRQGS